VDSELNAAVRALAMGGRVLERVLDDMTLAQYRVLAIIASSSERANRLAEKANLTRPSLSGLLDGLVARGWVQRVDVDGDRRGVTLELTAAGRTAVNGADRAMTARLEELLLDAGDERTRVLDGLNALGRTLRGGQHATAPG
jgi:DNA-binding MarR family transcriptional regulator